MNNLDLKYIFAGCLVLFIILYFAFPEIKKSLKEKFTHITITTTAACNKSCRCNEICTTDPGSFGTGGNCHRKCMQ